MDSDLSPTDLRPVDADDPASRSHLLALPALLRPISAELSALHAARVRLMVVLPPETQQGWCCAQCGHLREGWGWRVVKSQKKRKTSCGSPQSSKRRKADALDPNAPQGTGQVGSSKPRNALKSRCSLCGLSASFAGSDAATVATFPSARQAARRRTRATAASEEQASAPVTAPPPVSTKPHPPSLLKASPKLAHIPLSHPTPVTEVPPPPAVATSSGNSSLATGAGTTKPKKRKKSGLQKLLAESAARKQDVENTSQATSKLAAWGLG